MILNCLRNVLTFASLIDSKRTPSTAGRPGLTVMAAACMVGVAGLALCVAVTPAHAGEDQSWTNADFPILSVNPQVKLNTQTVTPQNWKPTPQPDLAAELEAAKPLTLVEIAPGPTISNESQRPYIVPNADGTWDMIYPYRGKYFTPQQMIIYDFGTGETRSQMIGTGKGDSLLTKGRWEFHLQTSFYTKGKLVIRNSFSQPLMFAIYDPQKNEFTHAVMPFGKNFEPGNTMLGADGKIYGIGWDKSKKDGFIAYWYDVENDQAWQSEKFGPAIPKVRALYSRVAISGDWVYGSFGVEPWHLVGYNFKTNESRAFATTQPIIGSGNTISIRAIEGGLMGNIHNAAMLNVTEQVQDQTVPFWIHEGKLVRRTDENTPWTGKPPIAIRGVRIEGQGEHQEWPAGFEPQKMTLKQIATDPSDVTIIAAKFQLDPSAKEGNHWEQNDDSDALGGVALVARNVGNPMQNPGVATVKVTFTAPGKYFLYLNAKTFDADQNGSVGDNDIFQISQQGDKDQVFSEDKFIRPQEVRRAEYAWLKLNAYEVKASEVGKPQTFKLTTHNSGVTIDTLLFTQNPNKQTSLVPLIPNQSGGADSVGRVELPYHFGQNETQTITYQVNMYPDALKLLTEVNDHILFGTADEYGQHLFYNLDTRQAMRFSGMTSPYSMTLAGDKLYVSGYAGAQLIQYDLMTKDGNQDGKTLDRPERNGVAQIGRKSDSHNPLGGTLAGADGNIYNAGITYGRKRIGGGFGWYDPRTKEVEGMPLDEQIFWSTTADNKRYLVFSTKQGSAKTYNQLIGWDTQTHAIIYKKHVDGIGRMGPMVEALPGGLVMGHASAKDKGYLYGLNAATGEVLWRKEVPQGPVTAFAEVRRMLYAFRLGPDGNIWTFLNENVLVRIDPLTAHITVIGQLPQGDRPGQIAFAKGNVYIAKSGPLMQIKDVHVGVLKNN